jgi:hypothetical protein
MNSIENVIVVLGLPKTRIAELIRYARAVVAMVTGNPDFPTTTPTVAVLTAQTDALEAAETATRNRVPGAAQDRNAKASTLKASLRILRADVERVANANPSRAGAIVTAAGMHVLVPVVRVVSDLAATRGAASGSVLLRTRSAGSKASYEWQMSLDGEKTWVSLPSTLVARTVVNGLTVGQVVGFRVRAATTKVQHDWSPVLTHVVV